MNPIDEYATHADLETWFYRGVHQGAAKMLVVIDNFDGGNYPAYLMPGETYKPVEMQKVRATFDLLKPFHEQCEAIYRPPKLKEALREADDDGAHWVTIDGKHVLLDKDDNVNVQEAIAQKLRTCEILETVSGPETQVVSMRVRFNDDDTITITAIPPHGNENSVRWLQEMKILAPGPPRRVVTIESDPEAWFYALPLNLHGSYCRARIVEG